MTNSQRSERAIEKLVPYEGRHLVEFPMHSEFDVAVVGGGPNGLIAGAYLIK